MEVYGVKPKKFTREWWGYFWYYYKWHTAGVLFALFVIITSLVQCVTQINYDLQIDLITEDYITGEQTEKLEELIKANIDDVTQNGETQAFVLSLNMDSEDPQMEQALMSKMLLEFRYSEGYVFIMSKKYADMVFEYGIFENTDVWAGEQANDGQTISLAGSKALLNIGIDAEMHDLYIGVLKIRDENKDDELEIAKYENGKKFAQFLINQR